MLTFFGRGPKGPALSQDGLGSIQTVRAYWEALRENGNLPRRDQIDPRGLANCLDKVFLIERIAKGHARFRLAGMHLNDLIGMDVRGMPISTLFEPVARARLASELEQVFDSPSIMEIWLDGEKAMGRGSLAGRMLLLPVKGSAGEPDLALGVLATDGQIGRQPRRFAITGMVRELITLPHMRPLPVADVASPSEALKGPRTLSQTMADLAAKMPPAAPYLVKPTLRLASVSNSPNVRQSAVPPRATGKPNLRLVVSHD